MAACADPPVLWQACPVTALMGIAARLKLARLIHILPDEPGAAGPLARASYAGGADVECDLIVIDTPPTRNALDFLDAPRRMTDFFESANSFPSPTTSSNVSPARSARSHRLSSARRA